MERLYELVDEDRYFSPSRVEKLFLLAIAIRWNTSNLVRIVRGRAGVASPADCYKADIRRVS